MPEFRPNQPIESESSKIEVEVKQGQRLPIGRHRFRLIVVDDSGNESEPDEVEVIVRDDKRPTAVLDAPRVVNFGQDFMLSGKRSSDIGGRIVRYRWELLDRR